MTRNSARKNAARKLAADEGLAYADALRRVTPTAAYPTTAPGFRLGTDPVSGDPLVIDLPLMTDECWPGGLVVGPPEAGGDVLLAQVARHFMRIPGLVVRGYSPTGSEMYKDDEGWSLEREVLAPWEFPTLPGTALILEHADKRPPKGGGHAAAWARDGQGGLDMLSRMGRSALVAPWASVTDLPEAGARFGVVIGVGDAAAKCLRRLGEASNDIRFSSDEGWFTDGLSGRSGRFTLDSTQPTAEL